MILTKKRTTFCGLMAIALLFLWVIPAGAAPIYFTSEAAFNTAAGALAGFESFEADWSTPVPTMNFADFSVSEINGINLLAQARNYSFMSWAITDGTGAQIDIEEDGTVNIFAVDADAMEAAVREVNALTAEIEIGMTYDGKVIAVKDFGAFVECLPGKEGLVHISEMANERIDSVDSICKPGDAMRVKCIDIDNQGRVRLSRKAALNDAAAAAAE